MSGWGVRIAGISAAQQAIKNVEVRYSGGAAYVVGPTAEYSVYVELGTSRMPARPFVRPAAERVQQNLRFYVDRFADDPENEDAVLRAVAVGVQEEIQRVITEKGLIDTGNMRASVRIQKVS